MKTSRIVSLGAWLLVLILLRTLPAQAQGNSISSGPTIPTPSVLSLPLQQRSNPAEVLRALAQADVVYLGETHDRPEDHQAQLAIIRELHQQNPKIAIALEMFQHPYQGALDRYLQGQITESQLQTQTQFKQRWGFPWDYYAPILRFAKANQLPVLALNTPTEITRKVARGGLESLTSAERQLIPPTTEIRTDNLAYRQQIQEIYEQSHQGQGSSDRFERFFLAQVLWDETMAAEIAQFLQANRDHQVVVLAGQGHIAYGYGIPSRVKRRIQQDVGRPKLVQRLVLLNPPEKLRSQTDQPVADYFWFTPD